uniref:Uncharacterized protein n=1 Tax=Anguilla anguilla TaxID=7936 RepID=A0A0E9XPI3_ANGAN
MAFVCSWPLTFSCKMLLQIYFFNVFVFNFFIFWFCLIFGFKLKIFPVGCTCVYTQLITATEKSTECFETNAHTHITKTLPVCGYSIIQYYTVLYSTDAGTWKHFEENL